MDDLTTIPSSQISDDETSTTSTTSVDPDEETKQRIKHLAIVGTALFQATNEINFQTDFFAAKEALNKFKDGIEKLNLDANSKKGMDDLIAYLQKKIDRRLQHSENQNQSPMK